MRHVFVETNWVVACVAPGHQKTPAALDLLNRAAGEELTLHLPAISIAGARQPITERLQRYLSWGKNRKIVNPADEAELRSLIDQIKGYANVELDKLDETLCGLSMAKGIEVIPLSEAMLSRRAELSYFKLDLQPFDQAILAAILVRAEDLAKVGVNETEFCDLGADLQPWGKEGNSRPILAGLYKERRIRVYGDFLPQSPEKYEG